MTAKDHYDNHLGNFYSWMVGSFESKQIEQQIFFESNNVFPLTSKVAIDLGSGHGIQSISLAKMGFSVTSIDFNSQLLNELAFNNSPKGAPVSINSEVELRQQENLAGNHEAELRGILNTNKKEFPINIVKDDIININNYRSLNPELIVCCGDTITHLNSFADIQTIISNSCSLLKNNGKFIVSFRDYSTELKGEERFILVKSDENRILTCFLEYYSDIVRVTDLLYEKTDSKWEQKVSSYNKLRISTNDILKILETNGMNILFNGLVNRLTTIIAQK